jgi:hypothetical protein
MTMKTHVNCRSILQAVILGAVLGFTASLAYGYLFAVYAILRSSLPILRMPVNGFIITLLANAAGVFIVSAFSAIVFGIIAAFVQAAALALVYVLSRTMNREHSPRRGAWIGLGASGGLILMLHLLFYYAGPEMLVRVFGQSSYVFWWGLPSLIGVGMTTWVGWTMRFGPSSAPEASRSWQGL